MALGYEYSTEYEVHIIAYVYHWEENTILSLPIKKRKRYVELINKQKEAENKAQEDANK